MALSQQPDQPDQQNSSEPTDRLEKPVYNGSLAILSLVNFLAEHPDQKLYVADVRSKTSPASDDGLLVIGPGKTLQAKFGQNRFAVISHPGRFQLTPESAALFREIKEQGKFRDTAATSVQVDTEQFRAFLTAVSNGRRREEEAEETPEDKLGTFETRLIELMMPRRVTANTDGFSIICDKSDIVHNCFKVAEKAGFRIVSLRNPNRTTVYQSIIGGEIGALLSKVLNASGYRNVALTLLQTDETGYGPYALVFHPASAELIILNKQEATQRYRLVRHK